MCNDNKQAQSETASENKPIFSASDMECRWEKLKAAGKVPPLADVLKIIKRTKIES